MSLPFTLYDLDPASARLCLEVEKTMLKSLPDAPGSSYVLALSGGADSTAMACVFSLLAQRNRLTLFGAHINHNIRPEALQDSVFVENLCRRLSMPFLYDEFDALEMARRDQIGLEEAGRKGRYFLLEGCRRRSGASRVLMAHHLGDLCEDIMMRLIRGAGWPALGGMRAKNGYIFRPFLHISRQRLLDFLAVIKQDWREDLSNQDQSLRRNRVRARVIPFLKRENPSVERSFNNLHKLSLADEEYWAGLIQEILERNPLAPAANDIGKGLSLPAAAVLSQPLSARLRLYYHTINLLARHYPDCRRPQAQFDKLLALDAAVMARRSGKIFQFQGGLAAQLFKTNIAFLLQKKRREP